MKVKLVLLLVAAASATALAASAQQPAQNQPYVITARPQPPGLAPATADFVAQPGQVGPRVAVPTTKGGYTTLYSAGPQNYYYSFTPDEHQFSQQAEQLARQLSEAKSDGDRDKIKSQLSEVLEKQFDQRQKRHEEEIKQLEAQIKKLKDLVDKRQENRREIISARLNQIVKESQGLGW
jgi:hypothetical protein